MVARRRSVLYSSLLLYCLLGVPFESPVLSLESPVQESVLSYTLLYSPKLSCTLLYFPVLFGVLYLSLLDIGVCYTPTYSGVKEEWCYTPRSLCYTVS